MKNIKDPIYGIISLSKDEMKIVDSPQFQRLRKIKQLSLTYLVFPSALHTRFEHSLGVCYLAGEFAKNLGLDEEETLYARISGLLHDIGHGPFGHTLESLLIKFEGRNHEEYAREVIKESFIDILNEIGVDWRRISNIICGREKSIVSRIIGGGEEKGVRISLDADHLDYLKRDNYFTGAEAGEYSISYLLKNLIRVENKIAVNRKAIGEINKILLMRSELARSVYFHKTRLIADEMLLKAAYNSIVNGLDIKKLWKYGDEKAKEEISKYSEYSKELIDRIEKRKLYKIAILGKFEKYQYRNQKIKSEIIDEDMYNKIVKMDLDKKYEIEREIAKEIGSDAIIIRTPPLEFRLEDIRSNIYLWDGENVIPYDSIANYQFIVNMNKEIAFIALAVPEENRKRAMEISLKDYI